MLAARLAPLVAAALMCLAPPGQGASAQEPDDADRARVSAGAGDRAPAGADEAGEVVSMLDLAHHEYAESVRDGQVVNADEYAEAREFTDRAGGLFGELGAGDGGARRAGGGSRGGRDGARGDAGPPAGDRDAVAARVAALLDSLAAVVDRKEPPARYRDLADRVTADLEEGWGAVAVPEPRRPPSADRGAELYRVACAVCHGSGGAGDGRAADGMDPAPPDLTSPERRREASPERDYQVIMHGIPETAMPASRDWLSPEGAWDLVAYLRSLTDLPSPDARREEGAGPDG